MFFYGLWFMKYSKEITDEICSYLSAGNTQRDSAALAGISEETYYTWQETHFEFSEAVKKAEYRCKARNIAIIQKAAEKTWQAAAWYLERRYHDEFALKNFSEITGKNGEAIKLFIDVGQGFIPQQYKIASASTGSTTTGLPQIQSTSVASESKKDNNSNSGVGQASTS